MRQFGGYTLTDLLQMGHEDFFELYALAARVQADHTLETVVAGFSAFHRGDVEALSVKRGSIFKDEEETMLPLKKISAEEYDVAKQLAIEYMTNRQSETPIQEFTFEDLKPRN